MLDPAAFCHDAAQFDGGRVAGHNIERASGTGVLERGIQGCLAVDNRSDAINGHVGVFQAHRQFVGAVAAAHHVLDVTRYLFYLDIPQPREVFAVY